MKYQRHSDGQIVDGFPHRMGADSFEMLEAFVNEKSGGVIPLRDLARDDAAGVARDPECIGMRHDVDHNLEHAVKFARWEAARGWRSTYFILHTAWYADGSHEFWAQLDELEQLGHEIGLHTNAVAIARDDGEDPGHERAAAIIRGALAGLRGEIDVTGFLAATYPETLPGEHPRTIVGTAAHGDARCDTYNVHNNDLWKEQGGSYDLADFGIEYEAYFLHRPNWYISDSGGRWEPPLPLAHHETKQTSMLIHPCHWDIDAVA